jgi:hypothetical protein
MQNPTGLELTRGPQGELWLKVEHEGKIAAINLLALDAAFAREAFAGWAEEQLGPVPYEDEPIAPPIHWLKPDAPSVRAIEIMDGPHKGLIHEVEAGWPVPDRFGLMTSQTHWYRVEGDKAYLDHSDDPEWDEQLRD